MRLLKLFCSAAIVLAIAFCGCVSAFAEDKSTYTVEVPDGFVQFDVQGQTAAWKNSDATVIINLAVSENTSNVKVNPNDAGDSYFALLESKLAATAMENTELDSEISSVKSELMELGEHDAIKVSMVVRYSFDDGELTIYQNCYVFETQNYIHAFVIMSDEDASQFSDDFIRGVKINDEAVARREESGFFSSLGGSILVGALKGVVIGGAVGAVIAIAKKLQDRRANKENSLPQQADEIKQEDNI